MITLLSRLLIKSPDSPEARQQYGMLCGIVGIAINLLLFGGKFFAGAVSGSIAITADAFNNLSDAGSSVVTMLGFRMAASKPDKDHPFGHGRFEYISGFVVSMIILLMAFELGQSSIGKIISPQPITTGLLPMVILAVSIAAKLYMAMYNRSIGKKIASPAMGATAKDSLSDAVSTTAVLLSMILAHCFGWNLDGWFGLLVAAFILFTGISAARETITPLLGQPPDPQLVKSINSLVMSYPDVCGTHDLIIHDYGPGRLMISLHAEVPSNGDILALHDTIDTIERQLQKQFNCHAVIHMDPLETDDQVTGALFRQVALLVQQIDQVLTIHDFRMVSGPTHINLIFDVVAPYDFHMADSQIIGAIQDSVARMEGNYFAVVTVDKAFV